MSGAAEPHSDRMGSNSATGGKASTASRNSAPHLGQIPFSPVSGSQRDLSQCSYCGVWRGPIGLRLRGLLDNSTSGRHLDFDITYLPVVLGSEQNRLTALPAMECFDRVLPPVL